MMTIIRSALMLLLIHGLSVDVLAGETSGTGEMLFEKNCSTCHPDGGNIFLKDKTLFKKDREAHKIYSAADIIKKMRNPSAFDFHPNQWSGMTVFDPDKLSDEDAQKIAEYIIQTFN